jgi:uncharacterized protein YjdB
MRKLYLILCALVFSFASYAIGPITGNLNVCVGSTTTVADTPAGGTWSTSSTLIATVSPTGVVAGVGAGTATITYTTSLASATAIVTVYAPPAANSCPQPSACVGVADTLIGCTVPGYWNTPAAMVDTTLGKGVFIATSAGTVTITYTQKNTGCSHIQTINVNPATSAGTISGLNTICVTGNSIFSSTVTGGTWSSSNLTVATVGSTDGVVNGLSGGAATISYSVAGACGTAIATRVINVVTTASGGIISGPSSTCIGATATLSSTIGGGTWTSSSLAVAIVDPSTGVVSGISYGTAVMSYTVHMACGTGLSTQTILVNLNAGAIHSSPGASSMSDIHALCKGNTVLLVGAGAGSWSSTNDTIASVSAAGVVYGVDSGVATITFTKSTGCFATYSITINTPPSISGAGNVCQGASSVLTGTLSGGTWLGSHPGIASVGYTTGVVTGSVINTGTTTITYSLGGCYATTEVTVFPAVTPITGSSSVCTGKTTSLAQVTPGGIWSSSNPTSASIDSVTGVVTAHMAGNTVIRYTIPGNGCAPSKTLAVNTSPAPITGASNVCLGATTALTDTTSGGHWVSGSAVATVGSATGIVTGVAGGSSTISYILPSGCLSTTSVTVAPSAITGLATVANGKTITLTNATAGGAWGSSNTAVATVGATTGVVTGVGQGTATITYEVSGGCTSIKTITVTRGLGIQQASYGNEIVMYPNPTTGQLLITGADNATGDAIIAVTDITGREVYSSAMTISATPSAIDLARLSAGNYFVTITSAAINYSAKITVVR